MEIRVHLKIHGRVQGVFFRANAQREALRWGLKGWVRNCPDGSVEALAEGESAAVEEFAQWCQHGPAPAKVERVDRRESKFTGEFNDFEVRY